MQLPNPAGGKDVVYQINNAKYDQNWTWDSDKFNREKFVPHTFNSYGNFITPANANTNEISSDAVWKQHLKENYGLIYLLTFETEQQYLSIELTHQLLRANSDDKQISVLIKTEPNAQPIEYVIENGSNANDTIDNYITLENFVLNETKLFMCYSDGVITYDPNNVQHDLHVQIEDVIDHYPYMNIQEQNAEDPISFDEIKTGNHVVNLINTNGKKESNYKRYHTKATANQLMLIPSTRRPIASKINHRARIVRTRKRGRNNNGNERGTKKRRGNRRQMQMKTRRVRK
jgi:hypothetical protein